MPTNEGFSGVSNCYVFKSRLQEYAQKVGLATPVYETIKEGPSHEPSFRSAVIVNNIRYDSLPGFFNRKAAEQSAAEVALMELAKSGEVSTCISQPVHETGLCKNLLQEYAQKMNYAIPLYQCKKDETPGREALFKCNVEIGGIQYIGAVAKTKKEAEIKAARTALLAIQSSASELSHTAIGNSQLTVIPSKKRGVEMTVAPEETVNVPKAKKARFKKKMLKKRPSANKVDHIQDGITGNLDGQSGSRSDQIDASTVEGAGYEQLDMGTTRNSQDERLVTDPSETETSDLKVALTPHIAGNSESGLSVAVDFDQSNHGTNAAESNGDTTKLTGVAGVESSPFLCANGLHVP